LTKECFKFLDKNAYINFGLISQENYSDVKSSQRPRVLVLGSGLSGLLAAKHLQRHNFQVTILEAKDRPGGRTLSYSDQDGIKVNLGGKLSYSECFYDRLSVLGQQLIKKDVTKKQEPPKNGIVSDVSSRIVPTSIEVFLEDLLEKIFIKTKKVKSKEILKNFKVGYFFQTTLKYLEYRQKDSTIKVLEQLEVLLLKYCNYSTELGNLQIKIEQLQTEILAIKSSMTDSAVRRFKIRIVEVDLEKIIKEYISIKQTTDGLFKKIQNVKTEFSSSIKNFSNVLGESYLDFICQKLCLDNHINLYEQYFSNFGFEKPAVSTSLAGIEDLITFLSRESNIQLNKQVTRVEYSSQSVKVTVKDTRDGSFETLSSDYVLCTIPAKVLQQEAIIFEPRLADWRIQILNSVVTLNFEKILLILEKFFWFPKSTKTVFSQCASSSRFLKVFRVIFQQNQPVVEVDVVYSKVPELPSDKEEVIATVIGFLKNITRQRCIVKNVVFTNWSKDEYVRGSSSIVNSPYQ
ncbi:MAG: Lysine-specific histone demethylase 1A, partial [Paramarteilia canceri]